MNDGVVALLIQWCLLCLVWMGSADRPLARISMSRGQALAFLAASLVTSSVSWKVTFLPAEVNIGGAVLPVLLAAWIWAHLSPLHKSYVGAAAFLSATLLFLYRKLAFWDPVLLVVDEKWLVPALSFLTLCVLARDWLHQCFMLFVALPMSDMLWQFSVLKQAGRIAIGSPAGQDLLWASVAVWAVALAAVAGAKDWAAGFIRTVGLNGRVRERTRRER